ncbi:MULTISPECIES: type IV pilin N-terminal domain-containing protein [Halococcus]|uniref:type IV pilin N-terminal domain-containing protein n=1 Tax=Halococcus TaxID=2249 RepID=UPI001F4C7046|nr:MULTISPECIES: type IV pilin N-terminal domain-containing protein [Halococcus]
MSETKMRERINELRSDSRAVSPVIGVVLMIAVVVILAAVVGAFATGVFGNQQDAPQATFTYDSGTITMGGGDTLNGANIYTVVDGTRQDAVGGDEITAGAQIATGLSPSESVSVVYDDDEGNSATLFSTDVSGGGNNQNS